jgi:hypothetical protein
MSTVDTLPRFLHVLMAPRAEIAYPWTMGLLAPLVRIEAAPQTEATPWATLHGTFQRGWHHAEGPR